MLSTVGFWYNEFMVRSRPEASSHFRQTWEKPFGITARKNPRGSRITEPGFFEDLPKALPPHVASESTESQPKQPHRAFWFKEGTVLYSIDFLVPRTPQEAKNRKAQVLDWAQPININEDNLVYSDKLGKWTPRAKMRHKTTLFGAFVIADIPTVDDRGREVIVKRFISLKDLQKSEDNPLVRFKQLNQ